VNYVEVVVVDLDWKTVSIEELKTKLSDRFNYSYGEKKRDDNYCGIYFHANDSPFLMSEHETPIKSFRATSRYSYPIFLFYNIDAGGEIETLIRKYDNIHVIAVSKMTRIQQFDDFFINRLFQSLHPRFNKTVTFHWDGFFLNPGWEDFLEQHDFDYIGAPWCRTARNTMVLPHAKKKYPIAHSTSVGNGGFTYRKRDKCLEVVSRIDKDDIDWESCPDDGFYSYFGFGLGIFKPCSVDVALKWAREPFFDFNSYGFHSTHSRMNDIIACKIPGNRWAKY
jgi:Protein of unknown function (DUF5672)